MEDEVSGACGIRGVLMRKTESKYYLKVLDIDMRILLQGIVKECNWIHGTHEKGK
jgi:hypothetical protein